MKAAASRTVLLLARAESEIALLDRTRPAGYAEELRRLIAAWEHGQSELPMLRYVRGRSLGALQRALSAIIETGASEIAEGSWLVERAEELLLESRIAEAAGTAAVIPLASARYPLPQGAIASELEAMARAWIENGAGSSAENGSSCEMQRRICSDDRQSSESLWSVLSTYIGQLRLPVRLRVDPMLVPVAACGADVISIRGGTWLTPRAAARIAEHEIKGHLLPRLAAQARTDVLRCGCAGATDDEEGRALLIERRLGLMDSMRRADLGARHLACVHLRGGATFIDAVRCLLALGTPLEMAIRAVLRASRGGGLGREIVYLTAMRRIGEAFATRPELERWFELGRTSLAYASARCAAFRAA